MRYATLLMFIAIFALVLGGCKDDENPVVPPGSTTKSYVGVIAGTGVSGSLTISIPTAKRSYATTAAEGDTVVITATLKINGGATIPLTGYYVTATGELYLAGGGYAFIGVVTGTTITGTFTYPGGEGYFNCDEGTAANIKTYCGRYQDNSPGTESGSFNVTVRGGVLVIIVYPDDAGGEGFVTAGAIDAENQIVIYQPGTTDVIATGSLNTETNTISGVYFGDPGGTWSGSLCN